jgi:hypothetical protein
MLKLALIALIAVCYTTDRFVDTACSFTYTNTGNYVFDSIRCKVYLKTANCSLQNQDPSTCATTACPSGGSSDTSVITQCPYKCNCLEPNILNNYSPPCYNGGTLVLSATNNSYSCACPFPYLGTQCQSINASSAVSDPSTCSNVDCYNTNLYDMFRCQAKCFPCDNQTCYNGGYVAYNPATGTCNCTCPYSTSTLYNSTDCSLVPGACFDTLFCIGIKKFSPQVINCTLSYYKSQCPFTCQACFTNSTTTG